MKMAVTPLLTAARRQRTTLATLKAIVAPRRMGRRAVRALVGAGKTVVF